jgi:hypothetical protein
VQYLTGNETVSNSNIDYTDSVAPHDNEPDYTNRWYWDNLNLVTKHSGQKPRLVDIEIYFNTTSQDIEVLLSDIENTDVFVLDQDSVNDTDHATVSLYYKELYVRREDSTNNKWHLLPYDIGQEEDHSVVTHEWHDWDDINNTSLGEHVMVDESRDYLLKDWHKKNLSSFNDPLHIENKISPLESRAGVRISQYLNYPLKANNVIGLHIKGGAGFIGKIQFFNSNGTVVQTNQPNLSIGTVGYHSFNYDSIAVGAELIFIPNGDIERVDIISEKTTDADNFLESIDLKVYNTAFNKPSCSHAVLDSTYEKKHYETASAVIAPRNNSLIISGFNNNPGISTAPDDKSQILNTATGIRDVYWLCQELGDKHPDNFLGVAGKTYNVHLDANYSGVSSDLTSDNNNISIYIKNNHYGWLKVHETFFKAGTHNINFTSPVSFEEIAYAFDSDIQANINTLSIQNSKHASFVEIVNGGIRFFTGGDSPTQHADFTISNVSFNYGQDFQLNWFYDLQEQNIKVWIDDNLIRTVSLPGGYPENAWSSNTTLDFLKIGNHSPYQSNQVFNGTVNSLLRYWENIQSPALITYNNDVTGVEIGAVAQTSFLATLDFDTQEIHSYFTLGNETGVINCDFQVSDGSHSYSLARFSVTLVRDIDYSLSSAQPYIIT